LKKTAFILAGLLLVLSGIHAQKVSEEEIRSVEDLASTIIFENYVGPVTEFNTRQEIRGIGSFLGGKPGTSRSWGNKYRLHHSFQPEIPEGLDGDILEILPDAGVDHIRNLRFILSGYLSAVYGYSEDRAMVVAEFITYYNAVHYKNMDHFSARYKPGVLSYLTADNAGLSTHYSEWAGKSRVVIPLSADGKTGLITGDVDTSTISQPEVVEEMRKEEDKALDTRKEMVEIREEELDEQQEELDEQQAVLEEKKEDVDTELTEKQEALEEAEPGSAEEEVLKEEVAELEEKKEEVEQEQTVLEEKQEELDKEQEEVLTMREDIAEDENLLKEEAREEEASDTGIIAASEEEPAEEPAAAEEGFWIILVDRSGDPSSFGSLWKIRSDGTPIHQSDLNSVRGTSLAETSAGIVVIAGKTGENTQVRPLLLDSETLEIIGQGESAVYAGSAIWTQGDNLFIISGNDQGWYLGKYSADLELLAVSPVSVHPDTALLFDSGNIIVQRDKGAFAVLSAQDLTEIK